MKIRVKGFFTLKNAMDGQAVVEVVREMASIRDILDDLSNRFGKGLSDLIIDSETGELVRHVMLLVNGFNYLYLPDMLDTPLKDGDVIALFPPIAGG